MLQRRTASTGIVYYVSRLLDDLDVPHAFSTRIGGSSPPPFESLNLGNPSGCDVQDDWPRVYANYERLQSAIGLGGRERLWLHQVHGAVAHAVRAGEPFECGVKGDAMTSDDPARVIAVRVADCVPVLIASRDGKLVAAIHAGWRGVVADVVGETIAQMCDRLVGAAADASAFVAAIGPCIGFEPFQVGPEVIDDFERAFGVEAPVRRTNDGKGRVDLRAAVTTQLRRAGLHDECIDTTDRCTWRDADEFYSHRRDRGITGRMAALVAPRS